MSDDTKLMIQNCEENYMKIIKIRYCIEWNLIMWYLSNRIFR